MVLRIGNAQGFWGDSPSAAQRLVKQQPDLDYLTLDYLAEVSMSIMAIQREKDHQLGYARDFLDVVESLIPLWKQGSKVKIVTNAGGLNPKACAEACHRLLFDAGCMKKIGIVFGDDVLPVIRRNLNNHLFNHLDNGESIRTISDNLVTANAYLGAHSIAELLVQGAEIIITGRVADPSLTLGPCVAHYQWQWDDYDRLAAGTIAGHLIECGTQVTGGVCTNWLAVPDQAHIGYPVVEVHEDGSFVVTKPKNTGGVVNEQTVKEQLLYEIGDPYNYLSPDVTVSFLDLKLQSDGENRIKITGAKGRPPPTTLKVSATYRDGFKSEAFLTVFGKEAVKKAKLCGQIILEKVSTAGYKIERSAIECLGSLDVVPGVFEKPTDQRECVLRVAVASHHRLAMECFAKEIAPLITSGPQGITGYTSGRPSIREVFGYWPCLIPTNQVIVKTELLK